jgi:predicted permease
VPFSGSFIQRPLSPDGSTDEPVTVPYSVVAPGYFRTLGLPLKGRDFTRADDERAPNVAVVNETLAKRLWPGRSAIGERLRLPLREPGPLYEVVGVVSDGKYVSLTEAQHPFIYLPLAQMFRPRLTLHVRTTAAPAAFAAQVRDAVREVSPGLPTYNPATLADYMARSLARERTTARLLAAFSGLALAIAAVGIYGMLAYAVARRTRELGVRMALGARPADLVWMVARQGAVLIGTGVLCGVVAALVLTRLVKAYLFGVTPTDPLAFAAAVALLAVVALVATVIPARRATRIDPLLALRSE